MNKFKLIHDYKITSVNVNRNDTKNPNVSEIKKETFSDQKFIFMM